MRASKSFGTKTIRQLISIFVCVAMTLMLAFPYGISKAHADTQGQSGVTETDPVVGSLKVVARFNDSMSFYDGHAYLVFTSYQDGVTFPCDSTTNYAAYSVDDSYYTDIANDLGNGSWRTGTDADQYFALIEKADLPGSMTVNRGQVITIGNYRDFSMSVADAALGAITNSSTWTKISDSTKIAVVNAVLGLTSSEGSLSEETLVTELESVLGTTDMSFISGLFDGEVNGGICYNRELYNQKLEYDQFENVTYEVDITQSQLDALEEAIPQYNKFSLLQNSCATVAVGLWNAALGDEYQLSSNGEGIYSFIQEPKFVRQSIENNLTGYATNKLDSVEDADAAATTDGVTYYVTAPSKVDTEYSFDETDALSVDAGKTSLDVLRYAALDETQGATTDCSYPEGSVKFDAQVNTVQTQTDDALQCEINSITFDYGNKTASTLSSYDEPVWFTASANDDCTVRDANGAKLASYYDAASKTIHFEVASLPSTVTFEKKAAIECSNLTVKSNGTQDVYYYNGTETVAVADGTTLEQGATIYVKPTNMTGKVVESITASTADESVSPTVKYDAVEQAYSFTMPSINTEVAVQYEAVTISENDDLPIIQVQKGSSISLSDYFTIDTASKQEMTLRFAEVGQPSGIVSISEDATLEALAEGKTTVRAYVNDDVFALVAIEVYDGDMVSVAFNTPENGTYEVEAKFGNTSTTCYYSGYLVKKGSTITVTPSPNRGCALAGAYYGQGTFKLLTLNKITGSFTVTDDTQIRVFFAKAEVSDVPDDIMLTAEGTYQLEPTLTYTDSLTGCVFDGTLTYTSSDEAVATVSDDGLITAVSDGIAVVEVSAAAGNAVTSECQITVGDVDGNAVVGKLTISARPPVEECWTPHSFVAFTSYEDGLTFSNVSYDRYYAYQQEYLDVINSAEDGVDGRLYNDSISVEDRESCFNDHSEEAGTTDLTLNKGDVVTLSAYATSSNVQDAMDAIMNGDIAQYPSFQAMLKAYMELQADSQNDEAKIDLFDGSYETLAAVFAEIYVNGNGNPINGKTEGGLTVNRELYTQFCTTYTMTPNVSYSIEITANELAHLKAYLANPDNNYYSMFTHNCATAATEIWNATLYDKESLHVNASYTQFTDEPLSVYASIALLGLDSGNDGVGVTNFVPGPNKQNALYPESAVKGDLNYNGKINIVDAQAAFDLANGVYGASYSSFSMDEGWDESTVLYVGDVNEVDKIDSSDARAIQAYTHGTISGFSA